MTTARVKAARTTKNDSQRRRVRAYHATFQGETGRQVLLDLVDRFGFFNAPTLGADAQATAYNEGQRSVVMAILRNAGLRPNAFPEFVADHVNAEYHGDAGPWRF